MSHCSRVMTSWSGVASWLLLFCLVSSLLARSAAGSCLSYGHSCWGAHGKRSEMAPGAPVDVDMSQDAESWDTDSNNDEPAWQKLRRFVTHRAHHAPPVAPPRHVANNEEQDDEQPPPRWLYQLMRQAAAMKLD